MWMLSFVVLFIFVLIMFFFWFFWLYIFYCYFFGLIERFYCFYNFYFWLMSLIFMSFVMYISSLVIYYSEDYMSGEVNMNRFIMIVLMFILSMGLLIISPNLISILLGWDGLGFSFYVFSYLLSECKVLQCWYINCFIKSNWWCFYFNFYCLNIKFWWLKLHLLLWFYLWFFWNKSYYYINYSCFYNYESSNSFFFLTSCSYSFSHTRFCFIVFFYSCYCGGVYLLIRFGMIIELYSMSNFVLFIGCLTMFMSGLGANFEFDLKSIIALSTLSQLGLMMSTIGLGYYDLAFFHLLTHALFKALLFMCAGIIIHGFNDLQDIRGMGGIINQMPLTSVCFLISNLALCGMPFLSGFYSKDLILELSLMSNSNLLIFMLFFLSTGLTVCYTFRLIYYVVVGEFNFKSMHCLGDENYGFIGPMFMLVLMSVIGGSLMSWVMIYTPVMICLPFYMKILALMVSLIGGWMGFELSLMVNYSSFYFDKNYLVSFLGSMWFMPYISTYMISSFPLYSGLKIVRVIDCGWSEEYGGQGMFMYLYKMSMMNQDYQFNYFKYYLLSFMFWVFIFVVFLIYTAY
uniref:NADH-ubiquinone oxidoreductase chain 5 n=1 Tax=Teleogryllus emma TaxID=62746 RepID=B8QI06_9ORTH|nr:NADH dehydrogenase subunit 5 [Teleogryllus emma]ACB12519.1 NADH dehydrogenase subunit 5 [Teleogryllus emma]